MFYRLMVCAGFAGLVAASGCCRCPELSIDQRDGVGTFMSLNKKLLTSALAAEVAPSRIRAVNGEMVTWVIRNPGNKDVRISLHEVRAWGTTGPNLLETVFSNTGGTITAEKHCGIGVLQARINPGLVRSTNRTCCDQLRYEYDFMLFVGGDSLRCKMPYDPELVVEGQP